MIFAFCECREKERERERFLEREPLELELVMGPTIFVLIFLKIEYLETVLIYDFKN